MGKWHGNFTPMESALGDIGPEELVLHALTVGVGSPEANGSAVSTAIHHRAFISLGRPTYLVSRELYEICTELEVKDQDLTYIFEKLPYPAFTFAFEKGISMRHFADGAPSIDPCEFELRQIAVCYPDNLEWLNPILASLPPTERESFKSWLKSPFLLLPREDRRGTIVISDINAINSRDEISTRIAKIAAALIMLWRSRPEFIVRARLSKADRYPEFRRGDLAQIRTWKLPDKLIIRKPQGKPEPTGRHVKAHWRAGHFRHYRHERYEHEPDGSAKVEFILPCMIHADELAGATQNAD
jgi:hypothetical protein